VRVIVCLIRISTTARPTSQIQVTLDEWRARALYVLLVVVAVAGLPAYVSPIVNAKQMTPLLWVYLVVYLAFVVWPLAPAGRSPEGWAFILLAYASAIASFARVGLAGSGRLYLVSIPVPGDDSDWLVGRLCYGSA